MAKYLARKRLPKTLLIVTFILIIGGVMITYSLTSSANTGSLLNKSVTRQANIATATTSSQQDVAMTATPVTPSTPASSQQATQVAQGTQGVANPTIGDATVDTSQSSQTGVFPLSSGGPLPISEGILQPTNIARVLLNGALTSIYAGSLTQNPQVGVLCVLQENLASGQIEMHLYQSPRSDGPLTILAVHNTTLSIADAQAKGTFNLGTDQFQW